MSTAFTTPTDATWQELLDEIVLAYSERRQVLGQSAYTAEDSRDVQAASYWTTLQAWLETNCVSFIDHDNGPLTDDEDDFLYFTLDNWLATAGLNASGFRRSTDGSSFSYGQMQEGDIIGPWIFEDLQKGFGALKWCKHLIDYTLSRIKGFYDNLYFSTCSAALSSASTDWVNRPAFSGGSHFYRAYVWAKEIVPGIEYLFSLHREVGSFYVVGISVTDLPYTCDFYSLAKKVGTGSDVFYDGDGWGAVENKLFFLGSVGEQSGSDCTLACSFDIQSDLLTPFGISCPVGDTERSIFFASSPFSGNKSGALLKWNFTNA